MSRAYEALLASCADTDETAGVWRRSLESLGYVCNEEVFDLMRKAFSSGDEKSRVSAVFAMGRSGDACWEQQVRGELASPNPELRFEAARACGELELPEAVAELEGLVEDEDREVQQAALGALGQIGGDKARLILRRYCRSADEATRAAAVAALDGLEFMGGDLAEIFGSLKAEAG
ncbi:MAG: hypothetical protein E3J64_01170 [Anaerolineales bacterium]|nr:MAG: hypothetical protein E3J64_01170 [Anaerolineales bacterium]